MIDPYEEYERCGVTPGNLEKTQTPQNIYRVSCKKCDGSGKIGIITCWKCRGRGWVLREK